MLYVNISTYRVKYVNLMTKMLTIMIDSGRG